MTPLYKRKKIGICGIDVYYISFEIHFVQTFTFL